MAQKTEEKNETREAGEAQEKRAGADETVRQGPTVRWDDSRMTSSYANVCNVTSTREEVTLLFGTNQSWHGGQQQLTVLLSNRIILNPYAAKRLSVLMNNIIREYEARFGEIKIEGA